MLDILKAIVSIPTPFNMVVFIVLIGSTAGVLSTIASQIRKYGCHRQEIEFKRELVDRGLSADEIEQIITARMPKRVEADEAVACV
jgi:hypothetical protein